ncbi:MAG: penicillin-insensitive murein endopeptidase [Actinomycetota bacterium]|nr:penicillin-insensitive murein endopeptidase [Actinomycetota bacterium]
MAVWILTLIAAFSSGSQPADTDNHRGPERARVEYRGSVAVGLPEAGSLVRGVRFPGEGHAFFTWDPIIHERPSRTWRRWGTDDLVRTTLGVLRGFAKDHPRAPRIGVGDLSVRGGGDFGPEVSGGIGHATHQNGLDVDVYYPLDNGAERAPQTIEEVDVALSQDLVDRFVRAGAVRVYVGPNLPLTGPAGIVVPLANHDNHLHARFAPG